MSSKQCGHAGETRLTTSPNGNTDKKIVAQSALSSKYQVVIDTAMSMERTHNIDDIMMTTQMITFTVSHDQQMVTMQQQLEQCQLTNGDGTPPPPIIDVHNQGGDQGQGHGDRNRRRSGPLSDGPEGTTKTKRFYKQCDNACWSHEYNALKLHTTDNCKFKLEGHIDSHTGANPAAGAS